MKPTQVKTALRHLVNEKRPAFIWGPPGAGKSAVVAQLAAEENLELRDVRLSTMDVVDVRGFPVPDLESKTMQWLVANFLPPMTVKKGTKTIPNPSKGILFLDEMNSALPAVQAAGYQLVLDRRVGEYVLPEGWAILAAGNRTQDRSVVHAMPAALANRFVHVDFDVSVDDWYDHAAQAGISSITRAFIKFRPGLLHNFDAASNPRAFPTPRSWEFADNVIDSGMDPAIEYELLKGTVGEGAATEFMTFVRASKDLPSVDEVLLSPDSAAVPEDPAAQYAICTALDSKTAPNNIGRMLVYMKRLPTEFQVLFMSSVTKLNREVTKTKEYIDWTTQNMSVLM